MKKSTLQFLLFTLFTVCILLSCDKDEKLPNNDNQEIIEDTDNAEDENQFEDSGDDEEKEEETDPETPEEESSEDDNDPEEQDEDNPAFSIRIVGTWARVIKELFYDDGTDHTTYYEKGDYKYYQFHADGSGDEFWDDGAEYTFTWYIEDNILTLEFTGTSDYKEFTIIDLTSDMWIGEEDSHTQIRRTKFQRVE